LSETESITLKTFNAASNTTYALYICNSNRHSSDRSIGSMRLGQSITKVRRFAVNRHSKSTPLSGIMSPCSRYADWKQRPPL